MAELPLLARRCVFPSFPGPEAPDWILRLASEGVGGICLFGSNVGARLGELTASLRAEQEHVLIAIDEEGGDVTRLEAASGSSYPGNAALGAIDDVALTERVASSIAGELASVGVNFELAPVADVNADPRNPVIGVRSFGADADLVARHVAAFVRGLQRNGIAACAKHFPGHGATDRDSHLELPIVRGDVAAGLPPFRAAVDAGVQAVMTGHVRVPGLGDEPATLNPRTLAMLRADLGYDGLVLADALEMRAISDGVGVEEGAVRALAAGVDALLVGRDLGEQAVVRLLHAVVTAVEDDRLSEERLAEAAWRVARVGGWAAEYRPSATPDRELGLAAARDALRVEGDVELHGSPLVIAVETEPNVAAGPAAHSLAALLPGARTARHPDDSADALVLVVRDAHRHEHVRRLVEAHPEAIVVEIGLPEWRPPAARGWIASYGGSRASFEAVVERLAPAGVTT